jgi:hypothetical protein
MNYGDIIREMESSGRYSEADELKRSMERTHVSEYDSVYSRYDAHDGLDSCSLEASAAEQAYDSIQYAERRKEEQREEEREYRRQAERRAYEQSQYYEESYY